MLKQLQYDFSILLKRTPFIATCSVLILYIFILTFSSLYDRDIIQLEYYGSAYMANIIMNQTGTFRYTSLLLVFPLIIAIPIGRMMMIERRSQINILTRQNKKIYLLSKHIVTFFGGFFMMFITLCFGILFGYIIFGKEQSFYSQSFLHFYAYASNEIQTSLRYYNLYFQNPMLYLILYSLLVSLMMGILSQLTMVISLFTHYKVIVYGGVFMVTMLTVFIHPMIVPFYEMLAPYANVSSILMNAQYFYPIFFFVLSVILSLIYIRRDVFIK